MHLTMLSVRLSRPMLAASLETCRCAPHDARCAPNDVSLPCVQLCDFGTAIPFWELSSYSATPYLVSRYYRAPEVVLGYSRSAAMDVWSAGCVLFELFTGTFCFRGDDNRGILESMIQVRVRHVCCMLV